MAGRVGNDPLSQIGAGMRETRDTNSPPRVRTNKSWELAAVSRVQDLDRGSSIRLERLIVYFGVRDERREDVH